MNYQAKLRIPFGVLGIQCAAGTLTRIDFLPPGEMPSPPENPCAEAACAQLLHYFFDPQMEFTVPYELNGTVFQQRVWLALRAIPPGETRRYGELSVELKSAAQAVGQACGANPLPIIIPCHRVVGKTSLGGFMQHASGEPLDIKRWLLAHEQH